ncbi:hypothetical protein OIDMADRAFT_38276 [Oidiodendron maius Zn]|uniref:Uncharacterized protein n=1 Tax=Oidiodendron maius (strain Zn) TaxID=913774 RepID=A0A0C3D3H3_OIDMZ|nr:hypothetical protein OIDMADRAFT_38276 [Oidiodendron maius Zn]
MDHRLDLVSFWGITPGSRVLEIGCGQGDCTIVLADAVGESGHVDAVDPGAPDYGAPYTLSQSQSYITSGPLGHRISFYNAHPTDYLSSLPQSTQKYDYVVLSHCIWYFSSPSQLSTLVSATCSWTKSLCVAEWSLRASKPQSHPHVLTALLLASLEAKRKEEGHGNIRTVLSPAQIRSVTESSSVLRLYAQEFRVSNEGLLDAYWEVSHTLRNREKVLKALGEGGVSEKELAAMAAMYDAVNAAVGIIDGGESGVRSMDVWIAKFQAVE